MSELPLLDLTLSQENRHSPDPPQTAVNLSGFGDFFKRISGPLRSDAQTGDPAWKSDPLRRGIGVQLLDANQGSMFEAD
jgi:hypothetical protein